MTPAATATLPPPEPRRLTLPYGQGDTLMTWTPAASEGPARGVFTFRGRQLEIELDSGSGVFRPTDVGMSLLEAIQDEANAIPAHGCRVLDIGTGSGVHTVAMLSADAAHVTAVDVNRACGAVACANVALNGLPGDRLTTVHSSLADLEPGYGWDLIVCNPPHFPEDPAYATRDGLHAALISGSDGRGLYDELLARLDALLVPGGTLVLAHSSLTDIPRTRAYLHARGYQVRTVQVCELDIPMRAFAAHRDRLLARLYTLRAQGQARFTGLRFEVHTLAATKPAHEEAAAS